MRRIGIGEHEALDFGNVEAVLDPIPCFFNLLRLNLLLRPDESALGFGPQGRIGMPVEETLQSGRVVILDPAPLRRLPLTIVLLLQIGHPPLGVPAVRRIGIGAQEPLQRPYFFPLLGLLPGLRLARLVLSLLLERRSLLLEGRDLPIGLSLVRRARIAVAERLPGGEVAAVLEAAPFRLGEVLLIGV